MANKQKLELTWIGKDNQPRLEPRILIEEPEKSYHASKRFGADDIFDNRLIFGDNLLALKALEQEFTGKVKCIYIDPPYNTGNAFEHYDDGLEHSIWLSQMRDRFSILKKLLSTDGTFFCQLNDDEMAYCKVLLDEIFGRNNFINQVSVKMKLVAGASGGGEDKRLKKNIEYILIYAKDYSAQNFNEVYEKQNLFELVNEMETTGKSWKYTSVLKKRGKLIEERTISDGSGDPITVKKYKGLQRTTEKNICREGFSRENFYIEYFDSIFSDTNAQTSIRKRIIDEFHTLDDDEILVASYVPKTGRDKGKVVEHFYISPTIRRVIWLKDSAEKKGNLIFKKEKIGTLWQGFSLNNLTKEGGVVFPAGKKPEALVQRVIELSTEQGDLVLDSFLGSGTTAAVAHKMKRRWIGIELGDHCHTHCIPRLKRVIDGEDKGGITSETNWKGGGGFRYYRLAPTLITNDIWGNPIINKDYNAEMLAEAICKLEGFTYAPNEIYWQQGYSTENDFIYVTTQFFTRSMLEKISEDVGSNRSLLICCSAFRCKDLSAFPNLTVKKIPKAVLKKCEWGHDDYSLAVENLPLQQIEEEDIVSISKSRNRSKKSANYTGSLLDLDIEEDENKRGE